MSLLLIELRSLRNYFGAAHKIIWMGTAFILAATVTSYILFRIWSALGGFVIGSLEYYFPTGNTIAVLIPISFLFVFTCFMLWQLSAMWLHTEQVFWSSTDRDRVFSKIVPVIKSTVFLIVLGAGVFVISWVLQNGLINKVVPSAPNISGYIVLPILFFPLTSRLWYLPVLTALNNSEPWKIMVGGTRRAGIGLPLSIIPQAVLFAITVIIFDKTLLPLFAPAFDALMSFEYSNIQSLSIVISNNLNIELLKATVIFACLAGPVLGLIAVMQVDILRSLIGSRTGADDILDANYHSVSIDREKDDNLEKFADINTYSDSDGAVSRNESEIFDDLEATSENDPESEFFDKL